VVVRRSGIDLHVVGPPSVCAHVSRREPHDVRQACCATPSQRIGTPTASLSHQAMTSVVPRHVPWTHRAFGCWWPLQYGTGLHGYGGCTGTGAARVRGLHGTELCSGTGPCGCCVVQYGVVRY